MKKTPNLNLPIYDTPNVDKFKVADWNDANNELDRSYKEQNDNYKSAIASSSGMANLEVIDARLGESNLGAFNRNVKTQLEEKAKHIISTMATSEIQIILDNYREVLFVDGVFNVNPLFIKSNTVLYFSPNTVLKSNIGYTSNQCLLNISNVNNITIYGNNSIVQMLKSEYTTGEWRHCVNIINSNNINIYNLVAKDSGGDGFYIGGSNYSSNVNLINCISDNNRRQGLSVISAKNVLVSGGEYKNTNGTNPAFGIDLEQNTINDYMENIKIVNVKTSGNSRGGISISPLYAGRTISVDVSNITSVNDCVGTDGASAILFSASPVAYCGGQINMNNITILDSKANGIYFQDWTDNNAEVNINNATIINCGRSNSASEQRTNNGVYFYDNVVNGNFIGNITFNDLKIYDNREIPLMNLPIFDLCRFANRKNIRINRLSYNNYKSSYLTPIYFHTTNNIENISISYENNEKFIDTTTLKVDRGHLGCILTNNTSSGNITFSLPTITTNKSITYGFKIVKNGYIRIQPFSGERLLGYDTSDMIVAVNIGDSIEIKSTDLGWSINKKYGNWARFTNTIPQKEKQIIVYSSIPTSGNWTSGEYVQKQTFSISGNKVIKGWLRVTTSSNNVLGEDWIEDYSLIN